MGLGNQWVNVHVCGYGRDCSLCQYPTHSLVFLTEHIPDAEYQLVLNLMSPKMSFHVATSGCTHLHASVVTV
jgi:hypothetical protein